MEIHSLFLKGKQGEATVAVPDQLMDDIALYDPEECIVERLELWKNSPITTMNIIATDLENVRVMAELVLQASSRREHCSPPVGPAPIIIR